MKKDFKILFCLVFLYSLIRIPILLSNSDGSLEDLVMGTVALEILEGLRLPFVDYHSTTYGYGGNFWFVSAYLVPFMAILESSLFANRLAPFFLHFLSLTVWYFVFKIHFTRRQTFCILLFFVFPPPQVLSYMFQVNNGHFWMILWMGLSLLIYKRFLDGKLSERGAGFCLGLLGGLSTTWIPTNFITVVILWIYTLLIQRPSFQRRYFLGVYLIWFLVGFSPWLIYSYNIDWKGVAILANMFPYENIFQRFAKNFLKLFFIPERGLQGLFGFHSLPHVIGYPLSAGYMAIYLAGLAALLKRNWGFWKDLTGSFRLEVFALIFSLIIPLLVALRMEGMFLYYYLFPLFPFVCMVLSKKSIAGFCLVACLVGDLSMIHFSKMGETLKRQGYTYSVWTADFEGAFLNLGGDSLLFEKLKVFLKGRPASFRKTIYQAMTEASFELKEPQDVQRKLQFIESEPEDSLRTILLERLGVQIGLISNYDSERLKAYLSLIDPKYWPAIYRGIVSGVHKSEYDIAEKIELGFKLCHEARKEAKGGCYEGLGLIGDKEEAGGVLRRYDRMATQVEEKYRPNFLKGVGENVVFDVEITKKFLVSLDGDERKWFVAGLEAGLLKVEDPFVQNEIKEKWIHLIQ